MAAAAEVIVVIIYDENDDEIDADETLTSIAKTDSSSHLNSEAI